MRTFLMAAICMPAIAASTSAQASCPAAQALGDQPVAAAAYLREKADLIGVGYVVTPQGNGHAEVIEPIIVISGDNAKELVLRNPAQPDGSIRMNSSYGTTFGAPGGGLVFYALDRTEDGFIIPNCVVSLLVALRRAGNEDNLIRIFINEKIQLSSSESASRGG